MMGQNWSGCGWGWGPGYFFGGPFGMIIGVLFWALVVYGVYYLLSRLSKQGQHIKTEKTPLEIINERYAKGELTAGEYAKLKKDLGA